MCTMTKTLATIATKLVLAWAIIASIAHNSTAIDYTQPITEDSPEWNCAIHGNRICGPDYESPASPSPHGVYPTGVSVTGRSYGNAIRYGFGSPPKRRKPQVSALEHLEPPPAPPEGLAAVAVAGFAGGWLPLRDTRDGLRGESDGCGSRSAG